jgi:hypothetical protein
MEAKTHEETITFPDGSVPTEGQAEALSRINAFLGDDRKTSFFLEGGAGTGKTFTASGCVKGLLACKARVVVAAPTHKACNVIERNLDRALVPRVSKPKKNGGIPEGHACVDTVAAMLGIVPAVKDDESDEDRGFAQDVSRMKLPGVMIRAFMDQRKRFVLIIDEVSMLSKPQLLQITKLLGDNRGKLIAVGDVGQLPPVKAAPIDFAHDFDDGYTLTEVTRQAAGNPIIDVAWKVRGGENWWEVGESQGFSRVLDAAEAFLTDGLAEPTDDEAERSVFIGYLNATVNAVQEGACRKLYGHGRRSFEEGELVIATKPGCEETDTYFDEDGIERQSKWKNYVRVVSVADPLRVVVLKTAETHKVYGTPVVVQRIGITPGSDESQFFESYYLSGEALFSPTHPYAQEKARLFSAATALQKVLKDAVAKHAPETELKKLRQDHGRAWNLYYEHEDKVLSFSHPFSITSHKSQGSTYREVFINAGELAHYDRRALYVAATRPSQRLVWSWDIARHPWNERNTE